MIAIADIGGTKSDWRIIQEGNIMQFAMPGYNASSDSVNQLNTILPAELDFEQIGKLYLYVAGGNEENKDSIAGFFNEIGVAQVLVYPDTLGVARGLYGNNSGWVGILGTGSAAFYYDGVNIVERKAPLGYIIGDEGSGVDLGKALVKAYLRGHLGQGVSASFQKEFPEFSELDLIKEVYRQGNGRNYLSQFVPFVRNHLADSQLYKLIENAFGEYFDSYFLNSLPDSISFSGSVAYYFGDVLGRVARTKSIQINRIIQSPIAGLTLYHQENG